MADHGQVEIGIAKGNDLPEHEATYERFVHLIFIGSAHIANILIGLLIGAKTGHWLISFPIFVVATLAAFHGLATGARAPSGIMVVISLIALALATAG